jgi:hypothetical protein
LKQLGSRVLKGGDAALPPEGSINGGKEQVSDRRQGSAALVEGVSVVFQDVTMNNPKDVSAFKVHDASLKC